jgi:guanylate kinase
MYYKLPTTNYQLPIPMIYIFCAPSGSGKSTMVNHLLTMHPNLFELSVSCTTRQPRGQEIHGREYYFITVDEFKARIANNDFIEYEQVYDGLYYGTLREEIERIERAGKQVLFDVDVKGGIHLKNILGDKATSIFICPPSIEELRRRLEGRGDTSPEMIEKRLAKAADELSYKPQFDRVVINDTLAHAFKQLDAIIDENK